MTHRRFPEARPPQGSAGAKAIPPVAYALMVFVVEWRLWTPIHGVARPADASLAGALILYVLGLGLHLWLSRRDLPAAACYAAGAYVILTVPPHVPAVHLAIPSSPGPVVLLAIVLALWLRPSPRTFVLAGLAMTLAVVPGPGHLAVGALLAEGLAAAFALDDGERRARVARALFAAAVVIGVVLGAAATATAAVPGKATPAHDALVVAFLAWIVGAWVVHQLVATRRPAFLALAAVVSSFTLWYRP